MWTASSSKIVWFSKQYIKTYEWNLYRCTACLILPCIHFCPNCLKSNTIITKGVVKKKEPINLMPVRAEKILIRNINRTFHTNFSQAFYKFLQELGEEMARGYSKSMFPVTYTCTQSLPQCTLILLS